MTTESLEPTLPEATPIHSAPQEAQDSLWNRFRLASWLLLLTKARLQHLWCTIPSTSLVSEPPLAPPLSSPDAYTSLT